MAGCHKTPHPGQDTHVTKESGTDPPIFPSGSYRRHLVRKFSPKQMEGTLPGLWAGQVSWWRLSDPQSEPGWEELRNSKARNPNKQLAPKVRPFCVQMQLLRVPVTRLYSPSPIKREHSGGGDTGGHTGNNSLSCTRPMCIFYYM